MNSMKAIRLSIAALSALAVAVVSTAAADAQRTASVVTVTAGKPAEFGFKLSTKTVKHGAVTFSVTNGGAIPHTFRICSKATTTAANTCAGKTTSMLTPGQKATLSFTFAKAGTYEYLCTVPGHAAG